MTDTSAAIFAKASVLPGAIWQIGVERLPFWIHPPEGPSFQPKCGICYSVDHEEAASVIDRRYRVDHRDIVEQTLRRAVELWRCRPSRMQTADPALGALLEEVLDGQGISVEIRSDLPGLRRAHAELSRAYEEATSAAPGLLTGPGVTLAQVEAFARAAAGFYGAAPWRLLDAEDVVRIEAPDLPVDPALSHAVIMRSRSGQGATLLFFRDRGALEAFRAGETQDNQWILPMLPLWECPASDADLWLRHGLPLGGGDEMICPQPACVRSGMLERPDAGRLAFFEGLLRALAASTETEMDSGRWEKEAPAWQGPIRFVFSLPGLIALAATEELPARQELDEGFKQRARKLMQERFGLSDEEMEDMTPGLDRAPEASKDLEELLDAARFSGGRRAVLLARRALALCPDSSGACLALAEAVADRERALELYGRALELAERACTTLSEAQGERGRVELDREKRRAPRARAGMAKVLYSLGRRDEAADRIRDVVRLDDEDFMGARDPLACLLLELGRDEEAAAVIASFPEPGDDETAYTATLLAFRREGDSPQARQALRLALRANPGVPAALLPRAGAKSDDERRRLTDSEIEAEAYGDIALPAWRATPGALTWLATRLEAGSSLPRTTHSPGQSRPPHQQSRQKKKRRR